MIPFSKIKIHFKFLGKERMVAWAIKMAVLRINLLELDFGLRIYLYVSEITKCIKLNTLNFGGKNRGNYSFCILVPPCPSRFLNIWLGIK